MLILMKMLLKISLIIHPIRATIVEIIDFTHKISR